MDVMDRIRSAIEGNPVVLFMKGSPDFPQCGFSMQAAQALKATGAEFAYVDVLAEPEVRANLPKYANWPTFPQLYINGELMGGCDIVMQMYETGELQEAVQKATAKQD